MAVSAESDPSNTLREAKGLALDLKKTLKLVAPWDRSLEFQRQRLRDHYVQLVFQNARADMAQQLLWSETSHAIIDVYRSHIQQIERAIASTRSESRTDTRGLPHGPVELRKVSQSFRTFLLQEEKFWRLFSLRLVRTYDLHRAVAVLARIGISEEPVLEDGIDTTAASNSKAALPIEEVLSKMDILQRSIICLGDLARYRELNEVLSSSRRPKGRNGSNAASYSPKTFVVSESYYRAAILLAPDNGTPFNQLAILATYQSKQFDALYYYYRAASTKQPFATVAENVDRLLSKAIQTFRRQAEGESDSPPIDEQGRLETFKQDVVILHALWARNSRSTSTKLAQKVEALLPALLEERILPADVVTRLMLLAFAALWLSEGHQSHITAFPARSLDGGKQVETAAKGSPIPTHIVNLLIRVFDLAQKELQVIRPVPDNEKNAAARISAVLRRVLPALRVSSRWMVSRFACASPSGLSNTNHLPSFPALWVSYVRLMDALSVAFPASILPKPNQVLEEDILTHGFLPLSSAEALDNAGPSLADNPHPNEEHLMRIADLLLDAETIASVEHSPIQLSDLHFTMPSASAELPTSSIPEDDRQAFGMGDNIHTAAPGERDDDVSTTTSDDPVNMAMRAALESAGLTDTENDDDDDDQDVVLFPRTRRDNGVANQPGPTAQDLLLQVLGSPEPLTPKGTPKAVPINTGVLAIGSPGLAQQPLLFGPNIWSGPVPAIPSQHATTSSTAPLYGLSHVTTRNSHQRHAGAS
ncbi:hypothetical protein CALCODRAFT_493839 [Calocera cornea HHB12733]|uniref:DNA/RNA-binding domain-containing protein n=1 Tax=Calocera cornea HHB12733 TaxID=1353952 RepID=A0A165HGR5_9BASI|nr:hypothetical protein CALCODRAFT_493839 [Calocera cornea HHB12733]